MATKSSRNIDESQSIDSTSLWDFATTAVDDDRILLRLRLTRHIPPPHCIMTAVVKGMIIVGNIEAA
eukprot:scaffold7820_cov99-Skeletonema_marinoi.AAC.7